MKEDYLHHIWKYQLFDQEDLLTTEGKSIEIINFGQHNHHAGPDFHDAKVKIGETVWAGSIEIHTSSSEWNRHKHQNDKAYNNVILHLVYQHDKEVQRENGTTIDVLELKGRLDYDSYERYLEMLKSKTWIPCQNSILKVDKTIVSNWIDQITLSRLERKSNEINTSLKQTNNDWQESFYHALAKNFGFKVNAFPFESLAQSLPIKHIAKHKNELLQIEALLFGQAGMLQQEFKDQYPNELKEEYQFLANKFKLTPISLESWKFGRLRPNNFPTIRIAQFAKLLYFSKSLFSYIIEEENLENLFKVLSVQAEGYWANHYLFDKASKKYLKRLGDNAIDNLIINTIVPFLFVYGKNKDDQRYCDRALRLLKQVRPENNSIVKNWASIGVKAKNAYQSQAVLELKNEYCMAKKCLNCGIGIAILKKDLHLRLENN